MVKSLTNTAWFIVALVLFNLETGAQRPGYGENSPKGKITGQIFDKKTNKPLEYANIALFKVSDSSLVTGGIADSTGHFALEDLRFGKFFLTVDFIGYKKETLDGITLRPPES